jgi:hypothetical protein
MSDYNGWKNWETWNYKLWLDEEGNTNWYYEYVKENNTSVEQLTDMLDNEAWERYDEINQTSGFFNDVVSHAIRAVNFREIAESIKESV